MAPESTIASQIRTALAQHLKRDVAKVQPGDRLREDLGLDSLAMIELLFKIEEHFDLEIPNEDLSRITTVADVTAYVEEKLAPQPAAGGAGSVAPRPASTPPASAVPRAVAGAVAKPASVSGPAPSALKRGSIKRAPAKVTSIKAAAKRRAERPGPKSAPTKKKGSRRA